MADERGLPIWPPLFRKSLGEGKHRSPLVCLHDAVTSYHHPAGLIVSGSLPLCNPRHSPSPFRTLSVSFFVGEGQAMTEALSELFARIAGQAALFDEPILAQLCRMAALESRKGRMPALGIMPKLIGIWDWDVSHDLNHLDPNCAELFGIEAPLAAKGLPNNRYITAVHPDDLKEVNRLITQALTEGGIFEARYRVVQGDRPKWVFARGFCTLDASGRPERLPGAIIELNGFHEEH